MISSSKQSNVDQNGLLTYILCQLKLSNISLFQDYIRKLHVSFQDAKHLNLTISSLLLSIEDKIKVLKHTGEWFALESNNTSAVALSAIPKLNTEIKF